MRVTTSAQLLVLLLATSGGVPVGRADDYPADCNSDCEPQEEKRSFGPCGCEERKTLMQWSYGTSFGGGPPGYDEPLVTDRPDFTEASTTVGRGVAQLEFGYTYTHDSEDGESVDAHSFPETLLRVGFGAEWLEFRIGWNYAEERHELAGGGSVNFAGSEDLYLGLKLALTPQEGILPEMAIVPQMTVPTGAEEFTADETLPGLNWLYSWDINDCISTAGSTQANKAIDEDGGEYVELAQSWTVGYSLSEQIGAYTEWFAFIPSGADVARPEHYLNGGFTYLVSNNLQLDVRAGLGLNDEADDFFAGTGAAVRF
jgi:hypothetical protein